MKHELDRVLREVQRKGCAIQRGTHLKLRPASGGMVVVSLTPNDYHAARNALKDINRILVKEGHGELNINGKEKRKSVISSGGPADAEPLGKF